ncbi:MAG: phenylalanine--tRNA ligase subunit beta [bacterium]
MKISYNWLQDLIEEKLPNSEKLADLLSIRSFEIELAEKKDKDYILDVDVLPNRAHDCFSHQGIAREVAAILKLNLKTTDYSKIIKNKDGLVKNILNVEIKNKDLCRRYTACVLNNVKIEPSSKLIQSRLIACGLKPINNIVDITNYVMLETGQPMHAFDADKISENRLGQKNIVVRRAQKGEKIKTLDGSEYDLDDNILLIADIKNPLCIAGIKGGTVSEINNNTKNIILEAANFEPTFTRRASQKLKLRTDASLRFEHDLDPNLTKEAIDMAVYLIDDLAGGSVVGDIFDVYPKKVLPKKIVLNLNDVNSLLGVTISIKQVSDILKRLGFKFQVLSSKFQVEVPTKRIDVSIPEDLIEEIGRIYGYENISSQFPNAALIPPTTNEDVVYQNKIRNILIGFGFDEVYNYSFVSDDALKMYRKKINAIEVANPISQEQKYLRPNLITNLIRNIKDNEKYFNEIKIFELGRVFCGNKLNVKETKKIGAVMVLNNKKNEANNFYELKGVLDSLFNKLRITDQWYDDVFSDDILVSDLYHNARRAEVKVGDECLGWIGEINNLVLSKLGIKSKVVGFELFFDKVAELATEERIYLPPSKYPAMVRDIAVLVERGTKVEDVLNLINVVGSSLVVDVDLFDIYEDEQSGDGRKSIAFHIIYQSDEHNLTDKEVNEVQKKIVKVLEDEGGWDVRK